MDKPLLHVASHCINVGDGALIDGIHATLNRVAGTGLNYQPLDVVALDRKSRAAEFDSLDWADYRLVLVGGGGAIDGGKSRVRSGMAAPIKPETVRHSPTPVAFVALGYNLFPGQTLHCRKSLAALLRACRDRGAPFSVRNDGSYERIREAVGPDADIVVEVPDPGFFVRADPRHRPPQFVDGRRHVLLQPAGDNLDRRLAGRAEGRWWLGRRSPEQWLVETLAEHAVWLVEHAGVDIVLAPHITRDMAITTKIVEQLPRPIARYHTRVLGVPHPSRARQFFAAYQQADMVIGMRGHSVICAVGLEAPCLAISTHHKVGGFMQKAGLSQWTIEAGDLAPERLRPLSLDLLNNTDRYRRQRDRGVADFGRRFEAFLTDVWRLDQHATPARSA